VGDYGMRRLRWAMVVGFLSTATGCADPMGITQDHPPGGAINEQLGEADYGVCRGVDPKCFHDWPRSAPQPYRVLLFTRTAGPRHADLGSALGPGINPPLNPSNVVQREMKRLLQADGIQMDYTEDSTTFSQLKVYHAVIFFSTSREALDDAAKTNLRQYLRAGGGFVGIHNAFGTHYNWPYYEGLLGNANFYDHGPEREGDVVVVDDKDASTGALPKRWRFKDEWYNLVPFPTHVRFLLTVDEHSWGPGMPFRDPAQDSARATPPAFASVESVVGHHPGHGFFHPVAWCQYFDGGKAWLTTLGHDAGDFATDDTAFPGATEFQRLIVGGIESTIGKRPFCR
jgi:type 1 glutamine amidotransferase